MDEPAAASEATEPIPVVCVGNRVDAFTWAGKVEIPSGVWAMLEARKREAEDLGHPVAIDLLDFGMLAAEALAGQVAPGEAAVALSNRGTGEVYSLQNVDAQIAIVRSAPGGYSVEVRVLAPFLSRRTFRESIAFARRIGRAFGTLDLRKPQQERCRRIDLAADFAEWTIETVDGQRFIKRARASLKDFFVEAGDDGAPASERYEQPETTTYRHDRKPTGIAICPGGRVMARLYDKRKELLIRGNPDKQTREEETWKAGGWNGAAPVSRLEIQIRTEALQEMRLRRLDKPGEEPIPLDGELEADTPKAGPSVQWDSPRSPLRGSRVVTLCEDLDALADNLDAVWSYATTKWLTLRVPGEDSRLHRCALDPRWAAAQAVTWIERRPPATRRRRRGGASTAQSIGCLMSNLAAVGGLPFEAGENPSFPGDPTLEELDAMTQQSAAVWVRAELMAIVLAFVQRAERDVLSGKDDLRPLVYDMISRRKAVACRFSEFVGMFWEAG